MSFSKKKQTSPSLHPECVAALYLVNNISYQRKVQIYTSAKNNFHFISYDIIITTFNITNYTTSPSFQKSIIKKCKFRTI